MLKVVGDEPAQDEVDGRSLLDEIAREGARRMLVAALETEVAAYLEAHRDERDADGHALIVRNDKGRARKVTVGAGTLPVSAPRVNASHSRAHAPASRSERAVRPRCS
jgi:putative transposase